MAKRKAVALNDIHAYGVEIGQVVEADAALIEALEANGDVDPHKDALAYADKQGAETVVLE